MPTILLIDNYDSFTYNLYHLLESSGDVSVEVAKNDHIPFDRLSSFSKILLSPGPGLPSEAGQMPLLLRNHAHQIPILGVCLGMQAIGERFSSPLRNLPRVYHGIATPVKVIQKDPLFLNCPDSFLAARYHSWVVDESHLHPDLQIIASNQEGLVMGIKHRELPLFGLQFHPESILSEYGGIILQNWLRT